MVSIVIFTFVPVSHRSAMGFGMVIAFDVWERFVIFAMNWLFILFHCLVYDTGVIFRCFVLLFGEWWLYLGF